MSGLLQLAALCEKADGPDRELDFAIHDALRVKAKKHHGPDYRARNAKAYTNTIDAAITLLPEGWKLRQMHFSAPCADDRKWHLNLRGGTVGQETFVGRGATPALALCSAALRARAAQ